MNSLRELLEQRRDEILDLARRHGANNLRIFGSVARGEVEATDIDFLVEMGPGRSFLDLVGLWQDLEDLLGCKVDVISEGGLSPYLRDRILSEVRPL